MPDSERCNAGIAGFSNCVLPKGHSGRHSNSGATILVVDGMPDREHGKHTEATYYAPGLSVVENQAGLIRAQAGLILDLERQRDELAEALTSIHNQSNRASIRRIAAQALARSVGDSQ